MADILLVHGSCHGAWCWRDTIPALERLGHDARAIDLPSHGADPTPVGEVTLQGYAEAIVAALGPRTVLVAHSMAGFPATLAARLAPERIQRLVYLCAYVPISGMTLADMRRMSPNQPLVEAIRKAPDGVTMTIDPALAAGKFFNDCPPETAAWAVSMLGPQPLLPQETPFPEGPAPDVPRSYIRCARDNAVPPDLQERMSDGWEDVTELPTSHSPFLSAPDLLAATIDERL